jgi:hypothetical protein
MHDGSWIGWEILWGCLRERHRRGVSKVPPGWVMGTLDMLGSKNSHFLILMGICLVDGVAGWRRLVVDKSFGT